MSFLNESPDTTGRTPNDDVVDHLVFRGANPPKLPKDFRVVRQGTGLRLCIVDRNKIIAKSGTTDYVCGWADDIDTATTAGLDAGAARAELFPSLHAPGEEDRETTLYLDDSRYQTGVFYCFAVDSDGNRTKQYLWAVPLTGAITDDSVPPDVRRAQVSETSEGHGDVTMSMLFASCEAPSPLGSFDGVQLWYRNYPNLGDLQEGEFCRFAGAAGGTLQFFTRNALGRRKGAGTVSTTNGNATVTGSGTQFTKTVNAGGIFEALGVLKTIQSVDSDTQLTLSATWPGKTLAGFADFYLYPVVVVYFVSVSKGGTHRTDVENSPSVSTVFDGDDSPPNAPTFTTTPLGNAIRLDITPVLGTRIEFYNVYRGTGSAVIFGSCDRIGTVKHDSGNPTGTIPYVDDKFSTYEREQGQVFSYYVTTVMRSTSALESAPSSRVNGTCRLNAGPDGDPSIPSRDGFKNMLFNGFIGGTGVTVGGTNNVVDDSDTSQDNFNNDPAIAAQTQANVGTGTSRLRAWTRWKYGQGGGATAYPIHINGNEVKLPAPGAVGKKIFIAQFILAWNTATQKDKKIKLGGYYTLQVKIYTTGSPNGTFQMAVDQYNGGSFTTAKLRTRLSDDTINETSAQYTISGSDLAAGTAASPLKIYAAFHCDPTINTDKIVIGFRHHDSSSGDMFIKEAMLNEGYELAPWTGDMGNIDMSYPTGTNNPGDTPDPPGHHGPIPA